MAMAAGKHKIFHKSSKITIFNVEIFNNVCKLNLSYLNLLHGHWCLLWKNLIWIIRLQCLYWILHQQRSSYCKEFQWGQRHQRAFLYMTCAKVQIFYAEIQKSEERERLNFKLTRWTLLRQLWEETFEGFWGVIFEISIHSLAFSQEPLTIWQEPSIHLTLFQQGVMVLKMGKTTIAFFYKI